MSATSQEVFSRLTESAKLCYRNYHTYPEKIEVSGRLVDVEFHRVGHNASHQFSIALLPDGRLVKRSCGEGEWDEDLGYPKSEVHVRIFAETKKLVWPYVGHY